MDMEKIEGFIKTISSIMSSGPWGLAALGGTFLAGLIGYFLFKKWKNKQIQQQTQQDRVKDQARNAVQNRESEDDAIQAADDIDNIMDGE